MNKYNSFVQHLNSRESRNSLISSCLDRSLTFWCGQSEDQYEKGKQSRHCKRWVINKRERRNIALRGRLDLEHGWHPHPQSANTTSIVPFVLIYRRLTAVRGKRSDNDDRLPEHLARRVISKDLRRSFGRWYSRIVVFREQTSACTLPVLSSIPIRFGFMREKEEETSPIDLCSSTLRFVSHSFVKILQRMRQFDVHEDQSFLRANRRCVPEITLDHHRLDRWRNMAFDQSSIDNIGLARLVVHRLSRMCKWIDRLSVVVWIALRLSNTETSPRESICWWHWWFRCWSSSRDTTITNRTSLSRWLWGRTSISLCSHAGIAIPGCLSGIVPISNRHSFLFARNDSSVEDSRLLYWINGNRNDASFARATHRSDSHRHQCSIRYGWWLDVESTLDIYFDVRVCLDLQKEHFHTASDRSDVVSNSILARRETLVCDLWTMSWQWLLNALLESLLSRWISVILHERSTYRRINCSRCDTVPRSNGHHGWFYFSQRIPIAKFVITH